MPEFTRVFEISELPAAGWKAVEVNDTAILVGRINDQWFACLDRCPHAAAPLRIGKVRGEEITCPRHGWTFNLLSGESVPDNPAFCLTQFPVKIEGSSVHVAC